MGAIVLSLRASVLSLLVVLALLTLLLLLLLLMLLSLRLFVGTCEVSVLRSETQSPLSATSRSVHLCFGAVWSHSCPRITGKDRPYFCIGPFCHYRGLPCEGVPQEEGPAYLAITLRSMQRNSTACRCGQKCPLSASSGQDLVHHFPADRQNCPTCRRCSVALGGSGKSRLDMARLATTWPILY